MKKLVITGALGHIGSKLIHQIQPGQFDEVILIDDLSTQRYVSLFNLPAGVNFKFYQEDILQADLSKYLDKADTLIHLAAVTNAAESFEIKEKVEKVNFEGTRIVADACARFSVKMIFLSSTSVYGTQESEVDENCPECYLQPKSPYAKSKINAENYLLKEGKNNHLDFIICRFGTIYGTSIGMRFHTAINKFCWQAAMNLPITIWKTALHQKRPYLDLDDAVKALFFIMEKNIYNCEIYNVLTDNCTVSQIVESIRKYKPEIQLAFVDAAIMNQLSYHVKNDKFRQLGFTFTGNLEGQIGNTIQLLSH